MLRFIDTAAFLSSDYSASINCKLLQKSELEAEYMKMSRLTKICVIIVLVVTLPLMAYRVLKSSGNSVPSVVVVETGEGSSAQNIMAEGTITAINTANVSVLPAFEGVVKRLFVNNGSRVVAGQVLAELDPIGFEDSVSSAAASLNGAEAQHALVITPHRPEEIAQAAEAVRSAKAHTDLILHPHRPEELTQMEFKLASDRQTISEAESHIAVLRTPYLPQNIAQAEASLASAKAKYDLAVSDNKRNKSLFGKDLIARSEMELSDTDLTLAKNTLQQSSEQLSLIKQGTRTEDMQIAQSNLERAKLTLKSDLQAYSILKQGSRPEEISQAKASQLQAELNYKILTEGSRPEQIRSSASLLSRARIEKQHLDMLYARRFVRTPISGVIVARNANVGDMVSGSTAHTVSSSPLAISGKSLFVISDDSTVEFMASMDQRYFSSVSAGQDAQVSLEAFPGRSFKGKVVRVNPLINPDAPMRTGTNVSNPMTPLTFSVWVRIPNPDKKLVAGQIGLMTIQTKDSGLEIPQSAVNYMTVGESLVYVVENDTVGLRKVTYDGGSEGHVRVVSGLHSGEKLIISDTSKLKEGMHVKTIDGSKDADNPGAY